MKQAIKSAFLCDDIRREDNGKFLALGIYGGGVLFNFLPSTEKFWLLCICDRAEDSTPTYGIRITYNGNTHSEAEARIEGEVDGPFVLLPLQLPQIEFTTTDDLICEYATDGGEWVEFHRSHIRQINPD